MCTVIYYKPFFLLLLLVAVSNLVGIQPGRSTVAVVVLGLQPQQLQANGAGATAKRKYPSSSVILDHKRLVEAIGSGRVYQQKDFLSEIEVLQLLDEIDQLEASGKFETKGLSNTAYAGNQKFSKQADRSICPIPWFADEILTYKPTGRTDKDFPNTIPGKIRQMQYEVSEVLDRPTIVLQRGTGGGATRGDSTNIKIHHEGYYSLSKVGSFLPRHMDERHEEMKSSNGWLLPSRRSLSWLIYLSTPKEWSIETNGGALRTFPQTKQQQQQVEKSSRTTATVGTESTHDGNLQVGWLNDDQKDELYAVYMDAFYEPPLPPAASQSSSEQTTFPEPHCILYVVKDEDDGEKRQTKINTTSISDDNRREYLTRPWLTESLQGMAVPDFLKACSENDKGQKEDDLLLFKSQRIARQFSLIEDRRRWSDGYIPEGSHVEDIAPIRGSLVIFDSVQLPHEVLEMKSGTRRALAGWWHEQTQEIPISWGLENDAIGGGEL